jgi:hypothetical protein
MGFGAMLTASPLYPTNAVPWPLQKPDWMVQRTIGSLHVHHMGLSTSGAAVARAAAAISELGSFPRLSLPRAVQRVERFRAARGCPGRWHPDSPEQRPASDPAGVTNTRLSDGRCEHQFRCCGPARSAAALLASSSDK